MGVIYKATYLVNGKSYIGQTIDFNRRQKDHLKAKDDYVFHRAIKKYGEENFSWEILEECENSLLNDREIYWIDYYNTYNNGYNSTTGGDNAEALINWKKTHREEELSYARKGLEKANEYHKAHKEEHLAQLASVRDKAIKARKRKVKCIELNLIFDGLSDAERWSMSENNPNGKVSSHQHISKVCKGQRNTTGGYHWEYVDE